MEQSSSIQLDGDLIRYRSPTISWDLPLAEVRIIGESTDQMGPSADDYFLCFATGPDGWYEGSFYANNRDAFLEDLETKLGAPLRLGLCHSTNFASRVLWPPKFSGSPLFTYTKIPTKGWLGRLLGPSQVNQTFSESIRKYLANRPE